MLDYDKSKEVIIDTARLIRRHEISIEDFFKCLGVDLNSLRVEDESVISELSGIFSGWENSPE